MVIPKDFMEIKTLPNSVEIFEEEAENLEKCIYFCVGNVACHAFVYQTAGCVCTGHINTGTNGVALPEGTVAMEVIGE